MRAVLLVIADAANSDGEHAHPGTQNLVDGSLYSRSTVFRVLDRLEEEKWVRVTERGSRTRATVFDVLMEADRQVPPRDSSPEPPPLDESHPEIDESHQEPDESHPGDTPTVYTTGTSNGEPSSLTDSVRDTRPEPSFDDFWNVYPRQTAKGDARRAWAKAITRASARDIANAAWRFARDPNLPEPQFIPHAATWLNQDRWEDGPLPERDRGPRSTGPQRSIFHRPESRPPGTPLHAEEIKL